MAFLPVECSAIQQDGNNELAEIKGSLNGYSLSPVVEVRDWAIVAACTEGKEAKMGVLQKTMSITTSDIEESLNGYSLSAVVEVRDWTIVASCTDRREIKMGIQQKAISITLSDIEDIFLEGYCESTRWN